MEAESGNVQENRYDVENLRFELLENGRQNSFVYHNGEPLHEEGREEGQTSDAFGVEAEVNEQFPNRIRYIGQQCDELAEQYYLRARVYNPVLGRFMQEDVYQGDGLNLYAYCNNNPVTYYDPSGFSTYEEAIERVSSMSYEDILAELWDRRNEYFNNKKNNGTFYYSDLPLLENEIKAVLYGDYNVSGDNLAVHHMPSAHSIVNIDGIPKSDGASSCVMTETHYNTFTCGMGTGKRPDDVALYEALSYEDRALFDEYDLTENYRETRPNVDMNEVELKMQEEYSLAMDVNKQNQEQKSDQIKEESC